ncbi:hypothetical protein FPV67DRAFT_1667907 [Lyophyllum atratum]|nr:hypothetical protein FPV67DRAFT_1667907 [Lyophyllum atratum]
MYTPVPLLAILALLAAAFGLVPSVRAQQIVHTLLAATLGASVLHLQFLARARLPLLIVPGLLLVCATLLSFVPPQAHIAPFLFLAFILTTLGTTLFLIIPNPFISRPRHPNAVSLTLPASPASSRMSFPDSHIEKPPPALIPSTPARTHAWFADPEALNTPASTRSTFKLPVLSTSRPRRLVQHIQPSASPTIHLFLLIATQLCYTAATSLTIPRTLVSTAPATPLVSSLIASTSAHHTLDSGSVFTILETTFTVLALLWTLAAYYYRAPSRCSTTIPANPVDLERGTRVPTTPTPVRIYTTLTPESKSSSRKHKRTLPSSSSTSSFFSPRPKRTPLPLAVYTTVTNTISERESVLVIGSDAGTDDIPALELGPPAVTPLRPPTPFSAPTLTPTPIPAPTTVRLPASLNLRMSPSPARRPTLVPAPRPHTYTCPVYPQSPIGRGSRSDTDHTTVADLDVDTDCTDLRDPFAPPPFKPRGRASAPVPGSKSTTGNMSVPVSRAGSLSPLFCPLPSGSSRSRNINTSAYLRGGTYPRSTRARVRDAYAASSTSAYSSSSSSSHASTSTASGSIGPMSRGCARHQGREGEALYPQAGSGRTQTRMSAWGRLPLPLPVPLPLVVPLSHPHPHSGWKTPGRNKPRAEGGGASASALFRTARRTRGEEVGGWGGMSVGMEDALLSQRLLVHLGAGGAG